MLSKIVVGVQVNIVQNRDTSVGFLKKIKNAAERGVEKGTDLGKKGIEKGAEVGTKAYDGAKDAAQKGHDKAKKSKK